MRDHQPPQPVAEREQRTSPRRAPAAVPALDAGLTPAGVLALQRAVGNAATSALLARGAHEHGPGCGHDEPVQRATVHDVLRGPGRPLDEEVRDELETRLGADFSEVRLHTGHAARQSAAEVGARAYTSGSHVVVGAGGADLHTLAHELTHVIQQRRGPVDGQDNGAGLSISDPSDRFERAAEANASAVMSRPLPTGTASPEPEQPATGATSPGRYLQRAETDNESESDAEEGHSAGQPVPPQELRAITDAVRACTCDPVLLQEGRATRGMWLRFSRNYRDERAEQTLRHISIRLFNCIRYLHDRAESNASSRAAPPAADSSSAQKTGPKKESEVQGMLINGRLVFATNYNRSITLLTQALHAPPAAGQSQAATPTFRDLLRQDPRESRMRAGKGAADAEETIERGRRARLKVEQAYQGGRDNPTADALRANGPVHEVEAQPGDREGVTRLRQLLTADEHRGSVILLRHSTGPTTNPDGSRPVHAEQKPLLALNSAGITPRDVTGTFAVRGQKRPCAACWAALEHYRRMGFPLRFNANFGAFYQEAAHSIVEYAPQILRHPPTGSTQRPDFVSSAITAKGPMYTSAYSREEPGPDAVSDRQGARQSRIYPREYRQGNKVAYRYEHGTGAYETASDSEAESDAAGSITSGLERMDLRGVGSRPSRPQPTKRPLAAKVALSEEQKALLQNAMTRPFWDSWQERLRATGKKSNQGVAYPPALERLIADLIDNHNVAQQDIARFLDVDGAGLGRRIKRFKEDTTPDASARRTMNRQLDAAGADLLNAAMTPEFRAEWEQRRASGTRNSSNSAYGPAMETALRELSSRYTASSIARYLMIPDRSMSRRLGKLAE
jgi:hypothetical protein